MTRLCSTATRRESMFERCEQSADGDRAGELVRLAVQAYGQSLPHLPERRGDSERRNQPLQQAAYHRRRDAPAASRSAPASRGRRRSADGSPSSIASGECSRCQYRCAAAAKRLPELRLVGQPPHRQPQRVILIEDVDGDGDTVCGSGAAPPARLDQVRGSSAGTSARCSEVDDRSSAGPRPGARSQGPDISRAVGQRRFSVTSHAAIWSVSSRRFRDSR